MRTLRAAGSPRLWLWGVASQRSRGGIFSEGRWPGLQWAGPAFRGGRREAERRGGRSKLLSREGEALKSSLY